MFVTEHEFVLPQGYLDSDGTLHREGVMRLATAADEILPLKDPRVVKNPAYLVIILLSRVVTKLGELTAINTATIEDLFVADLAYLQDLYNRINHGVGEEVEPNGNGAAACRWGRSGKLHDPTAPVGVVGYPVEQIHQEAAFIAYHFHWPLGQIMELEHGERRRWVKEISDINRKINDG